jgi:carboxypeptidase Q
MGRLSRNFRHLPLCHCSRTLYLVLAGAILWGSTSSSWSQTATQATPAAERTSLATDVEQKVISETKSHSEIMANLTYLSDVIGPRLTGTTALKKANDWTAEKMKSYGLTNVHLESWELPEGWERGYARGRVIEPDNQRPLQLASQAWSPGTKGKIEGDVIVLNANKQSELGAYRGKLKGTIVLLAEPVQLRDLSEMNKPGGMFFSAVARQGGGGFGGFGIIRMREDFATKEGAAVILRDASAPLGLLSTGGPWLGADRPSASNRLPSATVVHEQYAMLYRLATRPAPARTRVEIEITNQFVPGPLTIHNTVGEIRGSEHPDEVVVLGAHLDSWDLGQGTLDNGTGVAVVLETARQLARCGTPPKRTIRFVLFTGEEQGLLGSSAYVKEHKAEMPRISACIVHDTGTGKVTGLGWTNRPELKPVIESELAVLKELGVEQLMGRTFPGSDHVPFERAGVPACMFNQEIAGYRIAHHTSADTLDMANEADLIQGAQVMSVTALRLANRDQLLPRGRR